MIFSTVSTCLPCDDFASSNGVHKKLLTFRSLLIPSSFLHHRVFGIIDNNCDASKRLLCKPWDGMQGAEFLQRFAPQFEAAVHTIQDKYASLHDHTLQKVAERFANV
eukprot:6213163-Pleurochrysis_carterae.AAC.1